MLSKDFYACRVVVLGLASLFLLTNVAQSQDFTEGFSGYGREENLAPEELSREQHDSGGGFVRDQSPEVDLAPLKGQRYAALVPATLDMQRRAALALNALVGFADPEYDYESFEVAVLNSSAMMQYIRKAMKLEPGENFEKALSPLFMHTYHNYNGVLPKMVESFALLRPITGDQALEPIEDVVLSSLLKMFHEDGLYYFTLEGRPWALFDQWGSFIAQANPPENTAHIAALWPTGRAIQALGAFLARDPDNPVLLDFLERSMKGLDEMMIEKDDWGYFPGDLVFLDKDKKRIAYAKSNYGGDGSPQVDKNTPPTLGLNSISLSTTVLYGVSRCYKLTGSETAANLSQRLAKYLLYHSNSFEDDGTFHHHFHLNTTNLLALLEYATAFSDQQAMDKVVKGYDFARSLGIAEMGYWPESFPPEGQEFGAGITCEGCGVGDMVALSINLSRYGVGDYWDDADRFVRNQFAEIQMVRGDWIDDYVQECAGEKQILDKGETKAMFFSDDLVDTNHIENRSVGIYSTWSLPNDWVPDDFIGWTGCCLGNGTRAVYYAWNGIMEHSEQGIDVNLLLNRASPWLDVHSHIPYRGQVDLTMKESLPVRVRIPGYVKDLSRVICTIEDQAQDFTTEGRYIGLGMLPVGSKITITFPLPVRKVEKQMTFARKYLDRIELTIKGNTVVDIKPEGNNYPLYQRDHYLNEDTLWRKTERFVVEDLPVYQRDL